MRILKLVLLALILIALVLLALANREMVTLNLLPEGLSSVLPLSVQLPLFVVSLISIVVGLVLGYLFEYVREAKHRRRASHEAREAERLSQEVARLRQNRGKREDEVLAILNT
jgi:lipopolysaccharide assembly protein A